MLTLKQWLVTAQAAAEARSVEGIRSTPGSLAYRDRTTGAVRAIQVDLVARAGFGLASQAIRVNQVFLAVPAGQADLANSSEKSARLVVDNPTTPCRLALTQAACNQAIRSRTTTGRSSGSADS